MGSKRLLNLWMLLLLAVETAAATSLALPGCNGTCGEVSIPYPFGMGTDCSLSDVFNITCDFTTNPPKSFIGTGNIEIVNISLIQGEMRVYNNFIGYHCFNQSTTVSNTSNAWIDLTSTWPYRFSDKRNKFTAIGCYTLAYIVGQGEKNLTTGCVSICDSPESITDDSCTGIGCCQASIPKDIYYHEVQWGYENNPLWESVPCSYAMLIEADAYKFSTSDLSGYEFLSKMKNELPLVLDWAVRNHTCPEVKVSRDYACRSSNSDCYNSTNGPGYLCSCLEGYEGNPYLDKGCIDINECDHPEKYPCNGTCKNKEGSYDCICLPGYRGNATIGTCTKDADKFPLAAKLTVGISAGIVILLALLSLLLIKLQKKKYLREKVEYVRQNGGLILYEKMRSKKVDTVRVFTEEELKRATNNFDDQRILGTGGRGEVYLGVLEDGREVAIKKSKGVDQNQEEEFANEIIILSQINHRSVVRLLGCCLEVPVPMLVYEFIPNGTLFDFLHKNISTIHLHVRLEIAVDSADALAYLHSSAAHSIIHGDVKSLNILLGANYKAKVSDLGASSLLPLDKDQLVELVQGTIGYLDPECISTRQLTDKSDVYSFGVVLLELITRKPAIYTEEASTEAKSLASSFVSTMNQNKLHDILDDQIVEEGTMDLLQEVAQLALRCVSVKREERPTMKEVAEGLQILTRSKYHPWTQNKSEEAESLLGGREILEISAYATSSANTAAYNSVGNRLVLNIDGGR